MRNDATPLRDVNSSLQPLSTVADHLPAIISGWRKTLCKIWMRSILARIAIREYRDPVKAVRVLRKLILVRRTLLGPRSINKFARVNGAYYCDIYTPAIGSPAFGRFIESEAHRISPLKHKANRFVNAFVAITKTCPLKCQHCFEWEALNKSEIIDSNSIRQIIAKVQQMGASQIQITGGEPMTCLHRVLELTKLIDKSATEVWMLTSGYNLSAENVALLKNAGLTGVVISLDSANPEEHNRFRGSPHAFDWAVNAARHAIAGNLVTAFSICATKEFISEENLLQYARFARHTGVSFIQLLEPRKAGHFAGKEVELLTEQEKILEEFYFSMNNDRRYRDYPIVHYLGEFNRRAGCMSAGNRNLYIDTNGDMQMCPFCRVNKGSFLAPGADKVIEQYSQIGCSRYGKSVV